MESVKKNVDVMYCQNFGDATVGFLDYFPTKKTIQYQEIPNEYAI